jgi:hypothetical protein
LANLKETQAKLGTAGLTLLYNSQKFNQEIYNSGRIIKEAELKKYYFIAD